jgi:hypothetical protein
MVNIIYCSPERTEQRVDREEFNGGRGGGFRRGRGGRGGRSDRNEEGGFDRFGKREFDRHSGSDRTYVVTIELFHSFRFFI